MSIQFGRWNLDGKPVEQDYLEQVQPLLLPYGPDDRASYSNGPMGMLYFAFHTTRESRYEKQPHVMQSGAIVTWDGRLDNRAELIRQLGNIVTSESTDVAIVAAAYERWRHACFANLIGDWALAIWDPHSQSLTLAKDPIGVRQLYYSFDDDQVTWSTILDPLVLFAGRRFALCEEYIAGWFSYFPAAHLTPYVGIHSVPPSSSVVLQFGKHTVTKYWDFDPSKQIHYSTDGEYEEHFRVVFGEAVGRCLRSDSAILGELSGGMDSSSIVCMADQLIACGKTEQVRLETVSYYDDSEPNWNERPYFTKVEERRGRKGHHIDISKREGFTLQAATDRFFAIPGSEYSAPKEIKALTEYLASGGNRVLLSGVGGDEVMGGVPSPILEFEDLLATGQFSALAHQLKIWALNKRVPWHHLLFEAIRHFLPSFPSPLRKTEGFGMWLDAGVIKRNRAASQPFERRVRLFGSLPSFQGNLATLCSLQKQLARESLQSCPLTEKRYPYLDRSLLEFMYAVPRHQLVRPGQRRSLMRRALKDIVPAEILERKRKAYVVRGPLTALQAAGDQVKALLDDPLVVKYGYIDPLHLSESMERIINGSEVKEWVLLMKTVVFELWLKSQMVHLLPVKVGANQNRAQHSTGMVRAELGRLSHDLPTQSQKAKLFAGDTKA